MSGRPVAHIGENSPEQVAFKLMERVLLSVEGRDYSEIDRKELLDTYAECLAAVQDPHRRLR